jgi:hypothetical protein
MIYVVGGKSGTTKHSLGREKKIFIFKLSKGLNLKHHFSIQYKI